MPPNALQSRLLTIWAFGAGIGLWFPALAIIQAPLPAQMLDLWVILGWQLALWLLPRCPPQLLIVAALHMASALVSAAFTGPLSVLPLAHAVISGTGAILLFGAICGHADARSGFLSGFLVATAAMTILALAQFKLGAETLDFRNNATFRLPPHMGRAFALFPEVSSLAIHLLIGAIVAFASPRAWTWMLGFTCLATLALSRSTTALLLAPPYLLAAAALHGVGVRRLCALSVLVAALALLFWLTFFQPRWETGAAWRSASMRLATMLGAAGPLLSGDVFGNGLGQNHTITPYAYEVAQRLGLRFGQVPAGINAHIATRLFEEGLPSLVLHITGALIFLKAWLHPALRGDATCRALILLALGSLLSAGLVSGYRTLYTNWLWLALPAGLLGSCYSPSARKTAETVLTRIKKSRERDIWER